MFVKENLEIGTRMRYNYYLNKNSNDSAGFTMRDLRKTS